MAKSYDLYVNGTLIQFDDGTALLERGNIPYTPSVNDVPHVVNQTDTITYLAWHYYTKMDAEHAPKYWKYIAAANKIMNPLDLRDYVGKEIIIPDFNNMKLLE